MSDNIRENNQKATDRTVGNSETPKAPESGSGIPADKKGPEDHTPAQPSPDHKTNR